MQKAPADQRPPSALESLWPFFTGTFFSQLANNVLLVTMPVVLLRTSGSPANTAFIMTLVSLANSVGTLAGGYLLSLSSPAVLLAIFTVARTLVLSALSLLFLKTGAEHPFAVASLFILDNLMLGVLDTSRYTVPNTFAPGDEAAINRINSRYQLAFEIGTTIGPFMAGFMMLRAGLEQVNWLSPGVFLIAALSFMLIPTHAPEALLEAGSGESPSPSDRPADRSEASSPSVGTALRLLFADRKVRTPFLILLTLQYYRIKAVFAAVFATLLLGDESLSAWVVGMFGAGGMLGSVLYDRFHSRTAPSTWLRLSAMGLGVFALAWLPGNLYLMMAAVGIMVCTNVFSRLALQSSLQASLPGQGGGIIMGLNRFLIKISDAIVRGFMGLAFALSASPRGGFMAISAALIVLAVVHLVVAAGMTDGRAHAAA